MKSVSNLNRALKPTGRFPLVRLGRRHDGGYLVDARTVSGADILLSLGVNDDWSFERQFLTENDCVAVCYDGSISISEFFKRFVKSIAQPWRLNRIIWCLRVLVDYKFFFSGKRMHIKEFVGFNNRVGFVSMEDLLGTYTKFEKIFLKIDIEGSEYRCLEAILRQQDRIVGMAIEFHNYDLFEGAIVDFLSNLNLNVCHVHVNNFGGTQLDGRPVSVELSFSKELSLGESVEQLPHELDAPNNPSVDDFKILFQ